ncbi:MAG: molybdopterin-dependent oxidoreductase [Chthoniobacterales bacterium]|nr:molybdopterin-dependent oxidoreductase [Chthoniobacterales bacterium]
MSRSRAFFIGSLIGLVAGCAMTVAMLLLASLFGVATPLAIFGDRLSVFIPADLFLSLMGRVGGYNHMKQLGVGSVIAGQILVGALGGGLFGIFRRDHRISGAISAAVFILLPLAVTSAVLWPVLGTGYRGLPIDAAKLVTIVGLALAFLLFERTIVGGFDFVMSERRSPDASPFTPHIGRRAFLFGGLGILLSGAAGATLLRKLYRVATFSYDGTQYKGRIVQAITPNDQFYCVTKNVVDPKVDSLLWRLEISGLVQNPRTYKLADLKALTPVDQETTIMCISNGLDAGLMSNALWRGIPLATLLEPAGPLPGAAKVKLHGVDNYTDTFPFEKAMDATTLIAYEMNGEPLPDRHGFPARVLVPGYFGEKHVKWVTRIEITDANAVGFYEKQGWGPDFIVPTRSRFDQPDHEARLPFAAAANGIPVKGVAFGGDRGISRVEVSFDDGESWDDATLDYPGTRLTWSLWSFDWRPDEPGDYTLVARATDGDGEVQEWDEDRPFKSGTTGFHKIVVHVAA